MKINFRGLDVAYFDVLEMGEKSTFSIPTPQPQRVITGDFPWKILKLI